MNDKGQLPDTGFLRLAQILKLIPVSKSHWYDGVARGLYPQPIKLSKRITVWAAEDIKELIEAIKRAPPNG